MTRLSFLLIILLFISRKSKKMREQEILALKEMNDLVTVEYVVTKIIKTNDNKTWYKVGNRKILMSCRATIRAGIDFSALNSEHIQINGEEITVQIPPAHLISMNIRPEDIRVEYEEVGMFRDQYSQAEKDLLMSQGEAQIQAGIKDMNVLHDAETNASVFVTGFLKQLGYKKITVKFDQPGQSQPKL